MPKKGYRSLMIPEELFLRIKKHIEDSEGRYVTISEVVREAIWKLLKEASVNEAS